MIIKVDQEGQKFLTELADLALKGAGLAALQKVNQLGAIVKPVEEKADNTGKDATLKTVKSTKEGK